MLLAGRQPHQEMHQFAMVMAAAVAAASSLKSLFSCCRRKVIVVVVISILNVWSFQWPLYIVENKQQVLMKRQGSSFV